MQTIEEKALIPETLRKYVYYEEPNIVILHGDCLEMLPHFEQKSIDLVLTDPPYGAGIDNTFNDNFNEILKLNLLSDVKLIMFTSPKRIAEAIETLKYEYQRIFWWYKPNDIAHSWHGFQMVSEAILIFKNGDVKYPRQARSFHDVFIKCNEKQPWHPCCKPLTVIKPLMMNLSFNDGIILDPFLGSGTTAVAAKQLGRKCIGIEIEEKYCKIAVERLKQEILI